MLEQRQQQLVWLNCGAGAPGYRLRVPLAWTKKHTGTLGCIGREQQTEQGFTHGARERRDACTESHGRFPE